VPTTPATSPFWSQAAIFGILLLGLTLRVWTLDNGIPHTVGVDEPEILQRAVSMMKSGDYNPHFFDYGGLTIYFHTAVASVRFAVGAMGGQPGFTSLDNVWVGDFLLWARMATALIGTLLIYVVFRAGLRWGVTAALVAAFVAAIHPNLVRESHFALTDTPLAFLVAVTLLVSLIASTEKRLIWFAAAGCAAGLATAVKYNGALALLMPLAAAATALSMPRRTVAGLSAVAAAATTFLIAAPYSFLDLPNFLNAFAHLAASYNQSRSPSDIADLYVTYLRNSFGFGRGAWGAWSHMVGWVMLLVGLFGFGLMALQLRARDRRQAALPLLAFTVAYFWLISHQSLVYARYYLPILPMLCLAIGVAVAWLLDASSRITSPALRRAALAALILLAVPPTTHAFLFNWDRRGIGTAELAARWLEKNVPRGELIVSEDPYFRLPPGFKLEQHPRLLNHSVDYYRQLGAKYLVASTERSASPTATAEGAAAYRQLLSATQIVHIIPGTDENPGGTLTVLRIP
jgi:4-amino-4-deoxy-L-arabinose transferase-like glycosyltransferase